MTANVLELLVVHQMLEIILAEVEADIKRQIKQGPGAVVEPDMYLVLVEMVALVERITCLAAPEVEVLEILIKKQLVVEEVLEQLELQETNLQIMTDLAEEEVVLPEMII